MDSDNLKDWIGSIISKLVAKPDEVEIEKKADEMGVLYTVKVAKEDRGRVIGRMGNIAKALRTIVTAAGFMIDVRASLTIDTPDKPFSPSRSSENDFQRPEDR